MIIIAFISLHFRVLSHLYELSVLHLTFVCPVVNEQASYTRTYLQSCVQKNRMCA